MDFLEPLRGLVIEDMNKNLTREFMVVEVFQALQQMLPTKVLGSDDMPPVSNKNTSISWVHLSQGLFFKC